MSEENVQAVIENTVQEPIAPNYEDLASRQGWVPQEKWKGNPDLWKSAKDFYEDGEKFAPYIRANNRKLEERVNQLVGQITQVTSWANQQQATLRKQLEVAREENKNLIVKYQNEKAQAIQEGNGSKVVELENRIETIRAKDAVDAQHASQAQSQPQVDPTALAAFQSWHLNNQWYGKDKKATAWAEMAAEEFRAMNPTAAPSDVFEHAEGEVKKIFPQYSPDNGASRTMPSPEGGSSKGTPRTNKVKHSYADLPNEDKRVCDMVVADAKMIKSRNPNNPNIKEYTREQFVREYFGE